MLPEPPENATKMPCPKKEVYFRIFPTEKINFDYVKLDKENNTIYVRHLQEINTTSKQENYWQFQTNGIFFNVRQEDLYERVIDGVLEEVLKGQNALVFAFGQAGCGKTFTASGLDLSEEEFGILPRAVSSLFALKKQDPENMKVTIHMSYVEFYNTHAVDLLAHTCNVDLDISKCRDVRRVAVNEELDALKCIFTAEGRKNFKETCKYLSNITTTVATFVVVKKNMDLTNPTKTYSRLHIVDMAGNESSMNIKHLCKSPKELGIANTTKSQLEQFILCLRENIPEYVRVKQRINALMFYLAEDLCNESILRFIGHIKVDTNDIKELVITLSMLRFGNIMQGLKMKRKAIKFGVNEEVELQHLRNKLDLIEREKYLNSILLNQDLVTGLNPNRVEHLNRLVNEFVSKGVQEITVMNVADTKIVLQKVKAICQAYHDDLEKMKSENEALLELTKQRSDHSLKRGSNKSSSQSLASRTSRKSSKTKSKDSLTKEKQTSSSGLVSEKRIRVSTSEDVTFTEKSSTKRKKSIKTATLGSIKPSSVNKRKSSNTSIEKRDSRGSIKSIDVGHQLIPDTVPEKQDLLKQFLNGSFYRELMEEYKANEKDVKSSFVVYTREIRQLNILKDALDKCEQELFAAQTFRKFHKSDELDEQGKTVLSYAEKECHAHLDETKDSLTYQQEKCLKAQEEFKVCLENRHTIIKKAEEEFDKFCLENYRVPSAEIDEIQQDLIPFNFNINLESPYDPTETMQRDTLDQVPDPATRIQMVHNLQKLMKSQRQIRKRLMSKKKNEWKSVF